MVNEKGKLRVWLTVDFDLYRLWSMIYDLRLCYIKIVWKNEISNEKYGCRWRPQRKLLFFCKCIYSAAKGFIYQPLVCKECVLSFHKTIVHMQRWWSKCYVLKCVLNSKWVNFLFIIKDKTVHLTKVNL